MPGSKMPAHASKVRKLLHHFSKYFFIICRLLIGNLKDSAKSKSILDQVVPINFEESLPKKAELSHQTYHQIGHNQRGFAIGDDIPTRRAPLINQIPSIVVGTI